MSIRYMAQLSVFFLHLVTISPSADADQNAGERLYGVFKPGGFVIGFADPETRIHVNDNLLNAQQDGMYVLGFGRDATGKQSISFQYPDGMEEVVVLDLGKREYKIQRINGLKSSHVTPAEPELKRILQDHESLANARKETSGFQYWREPFVWPVFGRISGVYGSQRILNGEPRSPHSGIDIAAAAGTSVVAPAGGRVTLADDLLLNGKTVIIDHGQGIFSTLMHLQSIQVKQGDLVEQGQVVAKLGSTGRSTGPHLDWRINWYLVSLDPQFWVPKADNLCTGMEISSAEQRGEAVILMHGLGRTDKAMKGLEAGLQEQGYEVCNQEYPSTKVSIEQLSGYLANALQLLKARGYSKVHVVTHSMGGILARYYLQGQKLPGDGRVVMLSPPNQGSEIIDEFGRFKWFEAIMGPAALQLSTQSSLLNNRLEPIQADLGIIAGNRSSDPWFNFLFDQPHDGKVRVQSAKLNEMDDFVVVNRGHTRIMDAPEVLEFILNFLENASFHHEKGS